MEQKSIAAHLIGAFALLLGMVTAWAADYPSRPITLVVPFSPGSTTDISARILARGIAGELGQPVVVENKVGASGSIAAGAVARSKPDGYTVFYTTSSVHVIRPNTLPNLAWDPIKSFTPIALAAKLPQVLVVNKDLPVNNLNELLGLAKAKPNALNYASQGAATTQSLVMVLLNIRAGTSMVHVPYSTISTMYPDFLSGRIQVMFDNTPNAMPYIKDGRVRAIAVTSAERLGVLAEVPTVAEQGFAGFEAVAWTGLMAPADLPREIRSSLIRAATKALNSPEFEAWLQSNGAQYDRAMSPDKFEAFVRKELAMWKQAVELSGAAANK